MINKINNTTNKANPPAKPQPPQLPPKPITVPPLDRRGKTKVHSCVLTDSIYFILLRINGAGPFENKEKTPYKVSSFNLKHFKFNNIRSRHLPIRLKFYSISEQNFVLILNP
ncbi:hypothetical protein BC2926_54270 [Bacillus cereus]|nr:hypothetical protein BC2926_54270 [Bacillus cereus]